MVNIAVVMGLIYPGSKMGIREGLYNGGPLGEMIQWTDILTAMNSYENIKLFCGAFFVPIFSISNVLFHE